MFELGHGAAASGQIAQFGDRLLAVRARVDTAAASAPTRVASGWEGAAAIAYQRSLELLTRDLGTATELLRSASNLADAAVFELADDG